MGLIEALVFKLYSWYQGHEGVADAHHTPYTDAEVDAILAVHAALPSVHHAKYTDAEAVAAATTTKSRFYLGTTQTGIASGAWVTVQLNTVDFDADGNVETANYRYKVPETGYYLVVYSVKYGGIGADKIIGAGVYENAAVLGDVMGQTAFSGLLSVGGLDVFYLTANRYVTLKTYQNSGAAQSLFWFNKASTYMVIQKLL